MIWMNVWNTFFQCCLCGFMWGMNRYDRPSWATGLFVGLAMVVGAAGGIAILTEGKKVKRVEGVALTDEDKEKLARDRERLDKQIADNTSEKAKRAEALNVEKGKLDALKAQIK